MKSLAFSRYARSSCVALAMLAGCGGSQQPIGVPGTMPQSGAWNQPGPATTSPIDTSS